MEIVKKTLMSYFSLTDNLITLTFVRMFPDE